MPMSITGTSISQSNGNLQMGNRQRIRSLSQNAIKDTLSGDIIQTVFLRYDGRTNWSVPVGTPTTISDMNVTITPTYSTSRFLLTYMISFEMTYNTLFKLARNGTQIGNNSTDGNRWSGFANPGYDVDDDSTPRTDYFMYMDSPATLSPLTYSILVQSSDSAARTLYMNRNMGNLGSDNRETGISYAMVQEIR